MTSEDDARPAPPLTAEERAARKRRLDAVFGDVVPEQTSDDRGEEASTRANEEWLKRQVPPHHG